MVQQDAIQRFRDEFSRFEEASKKYECQELDVNAYRAVATGFGDYLQRDNHQMLRIRIPGGRLTKEMIRSILESSHYYDVDMMKITAAQAIQLHDLDAHAGRRLILRLLDAGIVTRGAGGDNPNNVSASPLSGVQKDEAFDVQPYAEAADAYLLKYTGVKPLPRKFKISFNNSPLNETHATFKDLGYVANADGTFDVYAAGGLGILPKLGLKMAEHVPASKILYYMRTMLDVFMENGNYENRNKARSRFLQDTMGVDGFRAAFEAHLAEVMAEQNLDLNVEPILVTKQGDGPAPVDRRIVAQKQEGLYAVSYHPFGGYIKTSKMDVILETIREMEDVEIRLNNEGGMYIINLKGSEAAAVLAVTDDGAYDDISASVACVGRARCAIGSADSQKLLADCMEAVKGENFAPGTLPEMNISGCISSCGSQQVGSIGWRGVRKKVADGSMQDAFFFSYGGCALQGKELLVVGSRVMLSTEIPRFLVELGRAVAATGKTFAEWIPEHDADLQALVETYAMPTVVKK